MREALKPILVTGSHRSGTTWVARNLALAPHTGYIHEPFNIGKKINIIKNPFPYWFQYICDRNASEYKKILDGVILRYQYPLLNNITRIGTIKNTARVFIDQGRMLAHKINNDTLIMKDPIAFFSAEWLSKTYGMNVLVMIRHPAAFCSSLKIKNWTFNFNNFLDQRLLMDRYLSVFEEEIREYTKNEKNIIDQAILLWNCIHHTVIGFQQNHPEWLFIKHEYVSKDPWGNFKSIFNKFDLEFTPKVKSAIFVNSGSHNSSEQQKGNEFKRDSKRNIYNWKKRLSKDEIERIKDNTAEISGAFYENHEW